MVCNFGLKKNATAKPVFGLAEAQGEQTEFALINSTLQLPAKIFGARRQIDQRFLFLPVVLNQDEGKKCE